MHQFYDRLQSGGSRPLLYIFGNWIMWTRSHILYSEKKGEIKWKKTARKKYQRKKSTGCANFGMHIEDKYRNSNNKNQNIFFFLNNRIHENTNFHTIFGWFCVQCACVCTIFYRLDFCSALFYVFAGHGSSASGATTAAAAVCVCNTIFRANIVCNA